MSEPITLTDADGVVLGHLLPATPDQRARLVPLQALAGDSLMASTLAFVESIRRALNHDGLDAARAAALAYVRDVTGSGALDRDDGQRLRDLLELITDTRRQSLPARLFAGRS